MAKAPPLDDAVKATLERIANRMFSTMKELDGVYNADGLHQLPVMQHDSTFRHRPIDASVEFLVSNVRLGARGQIIFMFEPADDRDYQYVEVEQKKMDLVFPLFAPAYAAKIGSQAESFEALIEATAELLVKEDQVEELREIEALEESQQNNSRIQNYGRF
jgi:hypothetical protein